MEVVPILLAIILVWGLIISFVLEVVVINTPNIICTILMLAIIPLAPAIAWFGGWAAIGWSTDTPYYDKDKKRTILERIKRFIFIFPRDVVGTLGVLVMLSTPYQLVIPLILLTTCNR